jgi:membrane-associated phospholipid phosphatase
MTPVPITESRDQVTLDRRDPPSSCRPEELILLACGVVTVALMAVTRTWVTPTRVHGCFLLLCGVLVALVFRRAYRVERALCERPFALRKAVRATLLVIRDFMPFLGVLALYGCLHDLTPVLRPQTVDARLVAIDHWLFGVDLSQWLGRFATPALTGMMVFCYLSFFVTPGLFAALLHWKGERRRFRDYLVSVCCVSALGFAGYLAVPAVGPYLYQSALFPAELPGSDVLQRIIRTLDELHGLARDCFPSLHTAQTTCLLVFVWRYSRGLFLALLPLAVGLFASTLYLRYHYGIDLLAGLATAALGVALGTRINRAWLPVSEPVNVKRAGAQSTAEQLA